MKQLFWKIVAVTTLILLCGSLVYSYRRLREQAARTEWLRANYEQGIRLVAQRIAQRDVEKGIATVLGGDSSDPHENRSEFGWPFYSVRDPSCIPRILTQWDPWPDTTFYNAYNEYLSHHPRTNLTTHTKGNYLPLFFIGNGQLSADCQKSLDQVRAMIVSHPGNAYAPVRIAYDNTVTTNLHVSALLRLAHDVPNFATALEFVWVVDEWQDANIVQTYYVNAKTGKVLPLIPSASKP